MESGRNPNANRGRHKQSYLEKSFEEWLIKHGIVNFETEKHFRRHECMKSYFCDFFFPSLNLVIELDGSQHKNTIIVDRERDEYIRLTYGVEVIRVTEKEYRTKSRLDEIKKLLNITF